jgi:hypothetical protein
MGSRPLLSVHHTGFFSPLKRIYLIAGRDQGKSIPNEKGSDDSEPVS